MKNVNNGNNGHNGHIEPATPLSRRFAYAAGEGGETALLRMLRVLRRRAWILVLILAVTVTGAYFYAVTRPMSYRSDATVEVGPDTPVRPSELIGESTARTSSPSWEHHFKTQEQLLQRVGLLRQVLESLPPEAAAEYMDSPDPVLALSKQMEIKAVPSTFLIGIVLEHRTPAHGPMIVNRLVDLFKDDSNRRLSDNIEGTLDRLSKVTLPALRSNVEQAEKAAQAFLDTTGLGDITERYTTLLAEERRLSDRLFEVRMRQIALGTKTEPSPEDLRVALAVLPADMGGRSVESLAARRTEIELELARLKSVFKDKHSTVVALRDELATVNVLYQSAVEAAVEATAKVRDLALKFAVKRVEAEQAAADEEEKALAKEEKPLNERILAASEQLARYQKLEAEVTASRAIFNTYLTKQAEFKAMAGAGVVGVRVVDRAGIPVGKRPNTQLILTLGVVLGLLFGAGAVTLAEQNDDRAATPYEAEAALGLDLLASIPRLPRPAGTPGGPLVPRDDPAGSPLEPFRRLRSEVAARLHGITGSRVVAILGPGFGEGKSTVAVNLARVLGLEGRRVLLFDADFRRPRLKALLTDAKAPGLEEYIRSNASLRSSIQPTSMTGVDLLGAAKAMEESPELPGKARFRDLWRKVRATYDYVIIDAGSVNAFSEVAGVAGHADASILVMDERGSKLRQVASAMRTLENLEIRILGLVVNRSLTPSTPGLDSGWSRGAYHRNGYGETPEPVAGPSQGESPVMRQMLDRLMEEFDQTKDRAGRLEADQTAHSTRESELRAEFALEERDHNLRLQEEIRRNAEISLKIAASLEADRTHEDERYKKLEQLLTKSLEGLNKKLTDLRLRAVAGGMMGGGAEGVELRPSQGTIDGIFNKELESNLKSMGPTQGKVAGKLDSTLERLKDLRLNNPAKKDDKEKG